MGGGGASSSGGGLGDLFAKLQAAQADLEGQAAAIDAAVVEGRAAAGAVVVRLSGLLEAEAVHIDPAVIDPADPALLEDLVLAALRDALGQAQRAQVFPAVARRPLVRERGRPRRARRQSRPRGTARWRRHERSHGEPGDGSGPDDETGAGDIVDDRRRARGLTGPCQCSRAPSRNWSTSSGVSLAYGPRSAQRIAFYLLETDTGERPPSRPGHSRSEAAHPPVRAVLQRRRVRAVHDLLRRAPRLQHHLRRRGPA